MICGHAENHRRGGAVLIAVAIDFEPHFEVADITSFIRRYQPRTDGAEGVETFTLVPCAAFFGLPCAFGNVIDDAVARDVGHGVGFVNVTATFADNDAKFDFPVGFGRPAGDLDIIIGATNCGGPFVEHDRFAGDIQTGFGCVIRVVQADTDKFADLTHTRTDTGIAIDGRERAGIDAFDFGQPLWRQGVARNVVDMG